MFDYKTLIYESAKNVLEGLDPSDVTAADAFCDYCIPCFKFAKLLRKSPMMIAADAAKAIAIDGIKTEALNGYLNFTVERAGFVAHALEDGGEYKPLAGKTVCLDYSSVNIAKPFHIGHLMTTVIGGSLCAIFR
ncbi:MAG: arginine--tRNA ligase [Clostridiales bacterium]|nr:arginine--tRNA ligase [Clostridiales bacterium]